MSPRFITVSLAALSVALAACAKKEEAASADPAAEAAEETAAEPAATGDVAADNLAKSRKYLSENKARDGVKSTESGLQYLVLEEGPADGLSPVATDRVTVHYVGTLTDGTEFDSSVRRGAAATFPLNGVISGWTEGLQLMSVGDRFRFFIPPELAYGETPRPGGPIGPNEALVFDVELISVSNPEISLKASEKFLADNAGKAGVKTTASGLQYEVLTEGPADGKSPTSANIVQVNYEGRLINGEIFDSSYAAGAPVEFPLAQVIPGWVEGVQLMSEGDKFRFVIPPALAYGEGGAGPIGPNEALVFEVELLDVKE